MNEHNNTMDSNETLHPSEDHAASQHKMEEENDPQYLSSQKSEDLCNSLQGTDELCLSSQETRLGSAEIDETSDLPVSKILLVNDSGKQNCSLSCSSSVDVNEKTSSNKPISQCGSNFEGDNSISVQDNSYSVCSKSMLQDDSVVEFSLDNVKSCDLGQQDMLQIARKCDSGKCTESPCIKEQETSSESRDCIIKTEDVSTDEVGRTLEESFNRTAEDRASSSRHQYEVTKFLSTSSSSDGCSPEMELDRVDFSTMPRDCLMRMVSDLLDECNWLKKERLRLENEIDCLEADRSSVAYIAQIEALEKSLAQAHDDIGSWEKKFQHAEQNYMTENIKVRSDLTTRLERVTKQYEAANKDKEMMVVKYATSEREVIVAKKQKEAVEKKMKEMEKERENILNKNKMLISERARICQTLDTKVQKNNWYQREVDRLKDELNSKDIKIKWMQTKLKSEIEGHQECQEKLNSALSKITKHEEELRAIKEEANSIVQATKQDEHSRANVLDMQLKEEKARLIMERQVNEDRGSAFGKMLTELEDLKHKHHMLEDEAASLRAKLASRESEQEEMEKLFTSLRNEATTARQEASDLSHQVTISAHLQQQLTREKEQLSQANQEIDRLQSTNNELETELLTCRQKEAELLAFTQKLSDKNVQTQSQFSALQSKTKLTEIEHEELKAEVEELKTHKFKLKTDLSKEIHKHEAEVASLKRQLAQKTEEAQKHATRALDFENEVQVLTRKHNNALKDLTREMQKLRRRLDIQENGNSANENVSGGVSSGRSSQSVTPHDSLSQDSRASSNTSLNTIEYQNGASPQNQEQLPPLNDPLVTHQLLVERIIRLQKAAAKRAEKMEFLEEHNNQLVGELKKKSRIIHHYVMREEAGALSNSASDSNKVELMKHGGIMASVYGSQPRDGTMTLELSLEINRKLQAVLEDTLLKNITLKENLNTLGDEIAKISQQKQLPIKKL